MNLGDLVKLKIQSDCYTFLNNNINFLTHKDAKINSIYIILKQTNVKNDFIYYSISTNEMVLFDVTSLYNLKRKFEILNK